jgi:hypothetical protein
MLPRRLVSATALAAATLATAAALPAAAPAEDGYRETEYRADVTVDGSWTYHRKETWGDRNTDEVTANLDFVAKASIDDVLFRNGALATPERWGFGTTTGTGSAVHKVTRPVPATGSLETTTSTCDVGAGSDQYAELRSAPSTAGHVGLTVRLARGMQVAMSSPCADRIGASGMMDNPFAPFGGGVFDKTIQLPHEVIGFGEVTELLEAGSTQRSPAVCPGKDAFTDECAFAWTATVKLVRTGGEHYDPAQQPKPPTPPKPPVDPRAEAVAWAVDQYGKDEPAKVDPRAEAVAHAVDQYVVDPPMDARAQILSEVIDQYSREVELELGCTNGCSGTAEIIPGAAAGGGTATPRAFAAAKAKPVARIAFKVPAGKPRKIRLRLPAKARKALARARRGTVRVTLRPRRGGPVARRTLVLRRKR